MSIWSEALTRALNEPVPAEPEEDLHAVPRRVSDQQVADIPDLKCKADCIDPAIDMAAEMEPLSFGLRPRPGQSDWLGCARRTALPAATTCPVRARHAAVPRSEARSVAASMGRRTRPKSRSPHRGR